MKLFPIFYYSQIDSWRHMGWPSLKIPWSSLLHTNLAQLHIWSTYTLVISFYLIYKLPESFRSDKNRKWSTVFIGTFLAPSISGSNRWLWKSAPETYTGTQTGLDLLGVTGTSQSNPPTPHLVWPRNYTILEINASFVEFHLAITHSDWYSSFICHNFFIKEKVCSKSEGLHNKKISGLNRAHFIHAVQLPGDPIPEQHRSQTSGEGSATFARYYNQFQTRKFAFCRPFELESFPY